MGKHNTHLGSLRTEEVEDPDCEGGVLAVLDEFAEVAEAVLLRLRVLLDYRDDRVRDRGLVLQPALVPAEPELFTKLSEGSMSFAMCGSLGHTLD